MIRFLLFFILATATVHGQTEFIGTWDCHIDCPGGPIKFGLEVAQRDEMLNAVVVNGDERIKVSKFVATGNEFTIAFDHYDSAITGAKTDGRLKGTWRKRRGLNQWVEMDFVARRSSKSVAAEPADFEFEGRWKVDFEKSNDPAVGLFRRGDGASLYGTFMTTTGDYRYLFGRRENREFQLSCFDGAHAFLFKAKLQGDQLVGDFWSSNTWHEKWTAERDDQAALPDAFKQTVWQNDVSLSDYEFPDLKGKLVRLTDDQFKAPAKLIYIFGSWCPNCHDAAVYFKDLQAKYGVNIKIVGLAFEHTGDFARDSKQVTNYLKRNNVEYPVLIAGTSDKKKASLAIPFLDRVRSYPTTIFVDSNEKIRGVHTGFAGPATGDAYAELKIRFESLIDRMIHE